MEKIGISELACEFARRGLTPNYSHGRLSDLARNAKIPAFKEGGHWKVYMKHVGQIHEIAGSQKIGRPKKLAGKTPAPATAPDGVEYETVSYNLPLDLIDLYRKLADLRHVRDQAEKRELRRQIKAANKAGTTPPAPRPPQARKSASAVVREALEAHRDTVQAEIDEQQLAV